MKRTFTWTHRAFSLLPLVWLAGVYLLVLRAWFAAGEWPEFWSYDLLDWHGAGPRASEFGWHHAALQVGRRAGVVCLPFYFVASVSGFLVTARWHGRFCFLFLGGLALFFVLVQHDPGGFMNWATD